MIKPFLVTVPKVLFSKKKKKMLQLLLKVK